jgi:phosphatidylserine/phosphatidylglycerophosphate/cardiolipin synthase-like enzyme
MTAIAISNNDMVYLHWHVPQKIEACLGFTVIRHDTKRNDAKPLPAMVGFPGAKRDAGKRFKTTNDWPVQKYAWKDVFAPRGGTYWYEIVPMIGTPGNLRPDPARAMRTNAVTLSPKHGSCKVFFNRGIISTQTIARALPEGKDGAPSLRALQDAIKKKDSPIRARLMGDLQAGVLSLLDRAQDHGSCYCALYELSDTVLVDHLTSLGKKKVHLVLSNAGEDSVEGAGDGDKTNIEVRNNLHEEGFDIADRILKKGYIGHNKFVVYQEGDTPTAVLSGSTNWTATGLCAQSNNAIVIESLELAGDYANYWKRLREDTEEAGEDRTKLQGPDFRAENIEENSTRALTDENGKKTGTVRVWFSPNTEQKTVPRPKKGTTPKKPIPTPPDLREVFTLIENAKQGVLFLAFIPGSPSIVTKLKEVYDDRLKNGKLFYLRGAATSPDPATMFRVELYHRTPKADEPVRAMQGARKAINGSGKVSSVAGIFATFAEWEAELYKLGHAVIHDKILVIDPFTDDSVVITGSHNLGYKASYSNDENMLIIRDDRSVASAYAAHVLDVYEHYRWRWKLQEPIRDEFDRLKAQYPKAKPGDLWRKAIDKVGPQVLKKTWQSLCPDDSWQDFYEKNRRFLAAETNFWSSFGGEGLVP